MLIRWLTLFLCLVCSPAFAGFHGGGGGSYAPNNNLAMMEFGTYGYVQGEYPYIDFSKTAVWSGNTNSNPSFDASKLNVYGNPTTASDFTTLWHKNFFIPSQAIYPSNYVLDWTGNVTSVSFQTGASSESINNGPGGSSCTGSGNGPYSGTNCQITITPTGGSVLTYWGGVGSDNLQHRFYPIAYGPSSTCPTGGCGNNWINDCTNQTNLTHCFNPQAVAVAKNYGAWRWINYTGGNPGNSAISNPATTSMVAWWADRTPVNYNNWIDYFPTNTCSGNWQGAAVSPHTTNCILTTNGFVSTTGDQYTLQFPGFQLLDRAQILVNPGAQIFTTDGTLTGSCANTGSCPGIYTLTFASLPTGLEVGMIPYPASGLATAGNVVSAINTGTNTVTLTCTLKSGGTCPAITGSPTGSVPFSPMVEIVDGGNNPITGYIPILGIFGTPEFEKTMEHGWQTMTYSADLNAFIVDFASGNNLGLYGGAPPEIIAAWSQATGDNPWINLPYMGLGYTQTDLVQQWATYNKNTLRGFVPRYEGPDEFCWNTGYPWGSFGHVVAWIYGSNSCYDWYGASMAVAGKTIFNTVYGLSAPDPTKAWVIVGEQASGAPSKGGGGQDLKLTATNFVSSWSGYPAYDWVTHTAFAGYWNPLYDYSGYTSSPNGNRLEIAWEYGYSLGGFSTGTGCSDSGFTQRKLICLFLNDAALGAPYGTSFSGGSIANITYMNDSVFPGFVNYAASYNGTAAINLGTTNYEGGPFFHDSHSAGDFAEQVVAVSIGATTTLTLGTNSFQGYIDNGAGSAGYALTVTTAPTLGAIANGMMYACVTNCSGFQPWTFAVHLTGTGLVNSQKVGSSGSPSTFTADSAWDYICNQESLCGNSGPSYTGNPTTLITGVCSELTGQTATIISANANTITLNIATDSGCTFATGGTASYPLSGTTQLSAFTNAAMQDAQLTPYELTNLQNFYASGGRDPAEYDEADCTGFTKYWTSSGGCNIYGSVHPVPDAVVEFNAAP